MIHDSRMQGIIALAVIVGITIAGVMGVVDSTALVAIYSAIIGAIFGSGAATIAANGAVRRQVEPLQEAASEAKQVADDSHDLAVSNHTILEAIAKRIEAEAASVRQGAQGPGSHGT